MFLKMFMVKETVNFMNSVNSIIKTNKTLKIQQLQHPELKNLTSLQL